MKKNRRKMVGRISAKGQEQAGAVQTKASAGCSAESPSQDVWPSGGTSLYTGLEGHEPTWLSVIGRV